MESVFLRSAGRSGLTTYYGIDNVEVDHQRLEILGELAPHSKQEIPLIKASVEPDKKKKRA